MPLFSALFVLEEIKVKKSTTSANYILHVALERPGFTYFTLHVFIRSTLVSGLKNV